MQHTPYTTYAHALETKHPSDQIVLCYSSAISFVQQAKAADEQQDHDTRFKLIEQTMAIVRGLRACLDFDSNPTVANALNTYYESLDTLLVAVQCQENKAESCEHIIKNLRTIKEAWESITDSSKLHLNAPPPPIPLNSYAPKDVRI